MEQTYVNLFNWMNTHTQNEEKYNKKLNELRNLEVMIVTKHLIKCGYEMNNEYNWFKSKLINNANNND